MENKYISFGIGYEHIACIIVNDIQLFNIDYIKIQNQTKQKIIKEEAVCM